MIHYNLGNDFNAYVVLHADYVCELFSNNLNQDEVNSALYSQFIEDGYKERKKINELKKLFIKIIDKMIKKQGDSHG